MAMKNSDDLMNAPKMMAVQANPSLRINALTGKWLEVPPYQFAPTSLVLAVKRYVKEWTGQPVETQELMSGGRKLDDDKTLEECGITLNPAEPPCRVDVILRPRRDGQ